MNKVELIRLLQEIFREKQQFTCFAVIEGCYTQKSELGVTKPTIFRFESLMV